ncbi:hypothetical protein ABI59_04985 [Acidobacteria bacterium Mor1]|nr:hypothetical protein ABI59_04985 [Acidobacteria bacterium Mor1]
MVPVGSAFQVVDVRAASAPSAVPAAPPVQMTIGLDDPTLAPKVENSALNFDGASTQVLSYSVVAEALGEELPAAQAPASPAAAVPAPAEPAAEAAVEAAPVPSGPASLVQQPPMAPEVPAAPEAPKAAAPEQSAAEPPAPAVGSSTVMATPSELGIQIPELPPMPDDAAGDTPAAPEPKAKSRKKAKASNAAGAEASAAKAAAGPSRGFLSSLGNILFGVFAFVAGGAGGYAAALHLQEDFVIWAPAGGFIALAVVALGQLVWKRRKR